MRSSSIFHRVISSYGDGKNSINGVEFIDKCVYDSKENKCVLDPYKNETCNYYEVTGTYPNFECSPYGDWKISEEGVKCIKKFEYNEEENLCVIYNNTIFACDGFEPRTTHKKCVKIVHMIQITLNAFKTIIQLNFVLVITKKKISSLRLFCLCWWLHI